MSEANDKAAGFQSPLKSAGETLAIGFVNNMPDAALRTTERQFRELLSAASETIPISLRFFSLPELPRSEAGRQHINQYYEDVGELWTSQLDGLIVTGTEPRAPELRDEPYWNSLASLVEWAENHTISTVWSCLAAHAAVLEMDGIGRRLLPQKLSGVFDSARRSIIRIPGRLAVTMAGTTLAAQRGSGRRARRERLLHRVAFARGRCGYLYQAAKEPSFFVQVHPGRPGTLLREYRRDVQTVLSHEPADLSGNAARLFRREDFQRHLNEFRDLALRDRNIDLLEKLPLVRGEGKMPHPWRDSRSSSTRTGSRT